jgi:hypothetical protein
MTIEAIPDLWGPISVDVVSPLAVLRSQAGRLSGHTKGLLTADVRTAVDNAGVTHTFQIVAPSLKGYRYDLFSAAHDPELIYPVTVSFRPWQDDDRSDDLRLPSGRTLDINALAGGVPGRKAATTDDFVEMVREALTAPYTQSIVSSLIAKSNEVVSQPAA